MLTTIPGPVGKLEALLDEPATTPRAAVVFAHPHPLYGGTMHTKVVYAGAKALQRIGCAVLRFNFRGVGTSAGTFDEGRGELDDFRAALNFMAERYPGLELWTAGFSFGAWISLTAGASDGRVSVLLAIAPPTRYDLSAVLTSDKPKFFIHGERDDIFPPKEIQQFYATAREPKELVVIDAADHLFDGKVSEVADAIEDLLGDFETGDFQSAGSTF
jgi:alpha/beta superfamily hydrolase